MFTKRNDSVCFFKKMGSSELFRVRFCWRREGIKRKLQRLMEKVIPGIPKSVDVVGNENFEHGASTSLEIHLRFLDGFFYAGS